MLPVSAAAAWARAIGEYEVRDRFRHWQGTKESAAPNEEIWRAHTRLNAQTKPSGLASAAVVARFDGSERLFPE